MNSAIPLVFGVVALFFLIAYAFWRPLRNSWLKEQTKPALSFNEEIAEELAIPISQQEQKKEQFYPREPELPDFYGVDRLVLMVRDPHWLYAYWEVSATKQEEFNANYGSGAWDTSSPVLRVYEVNGESIESSNLLVYADIGLSNKDINWHINVGKPNSNFCVDFGRILDGKFITILRSNIVTTPRESLSDCFDEEWMWIEDIYRSVGRISYGVSSPMISERLGIEKVLPLNVSSPGIGVGKHNE